MDDDHMNIKEGHVTVEDTKRDVWWPQLIIIREYHQTVEDAKTDDAWMITQGHQKVEDTDSGVKGRAVWMDDYMLWCMQLSTAK